MVKQLKIADYTASNNIFLAPMAGYTDYGFRHLILELGAGLCFTELVSAKGLCYGGEGSKELIFSGDDQNKTAVQIFGADPFFMRKACESEELRPFKIVDINMGCPVPKVFKNGEGSALLTDIAKAEKIVKECVKSGKIITIKIRTGQKVGDNIASEFAVMAENCGAKAITIHGRVRESYYSGEPDFNAIEKAKKSVGIPVIANGGIFTKEDAFNMFDKTGADGIMIGRGAIFNPFIFSSLTEKNTSLTLKDFIFLQLDTAKERYGDKKASVEFRKFVSYYFKGLEGAKNLKIRLMSSESTDDIKGLISEFF